MSVIGIDDDSNIGEEVESFKMAIEKVIRDPIHSYFAFNEESGRNTCLTGGCGVAVKGKNVTNLKYHLKEKHSKEYVHMMSKSEKRNNQIQQQFFEFNGEIGKTKCKICGVLIKGKSLMGMKLHLNKHTKEEDESREVELIPLPGNPSIELQNSSPPEPSRSVQPKPAEKLKIKKRRPVIDTSSPLFKEPFKKGWKREVVYRAFVDPNKKILCDVYYYTPKGKKLRSGPEILNYLKKVNSTLTLENFTFSKELLGIGAQETMRKANPRHTYSSSKKANLKVDKEMKLQARTDKLRRNALKRNTLKVCEKKLQRKFKKDQVLRIHQEKLRKNLLKLRIRQEKLLKRLDKLGVDREATTLPLNQPLIAPVYLPLGTTLVFSDPSSIKIKYASTDNSCATVDTDVSGLQVRPVTASIIATDVSTTLVHSDLLDESHIDEQRKDNSAPASSNRPIVPSCSTSVISQPALNQTIEKPRRDYQNLSQSFHSQSLLESPSSFLEHLGLIANGKPFYLRRTTLSEESMPSPVQLQKQIIPIDSSVVHPKTKSYPVRIVGKRPDEPSPDPSVLLASTAPPSQRLTAAFQSYHQHQKQSSKRPRVPLIEID